MRVIQENIGHVFCAERANQHNGSINKGNPVRIIRQGLKPPFQRESHIDYIAILPLTVNTNVLSSFHSAIKLLTIDTNLRSFRPCRITKFKDHLDGLFTTEMETCTVFFWE